SSILSKSTATNLSYPLTLHDALPISLLLEEKTYNGKPFPPHALLPISEVHFNRWLDLFQETTEKLFKGEKADEAVWRARKMAALFQHKLEYIRNNPDKPLLM